MTSLIDLYNEAEQQNIKILAYPLKKRAAISTSDGYIGIDVEKLSTGAEEKICLAHEIGHCITGSFYNIYSDLDIRQKHEICADKWAIKKLVPIDELEEAIKKEINEIWDLAEYFGVNIEFMKKAINYYKLLNE